MNSTNHLWTMLLIYYKVQLHISFIAECVWRLQDQITFLWKLIHNCLDLFASSYLHDKEVETWLSSFQSCNIEDNANKKWSKTPFSEKFQGQWIWQFSRLTSICGNCVKCFAMHWQKHDLSLVKNVSMKCFQLSIHETMHLKNLDPCSNPNVHEYISTLMDVKG